MTLTIRTVLTACLFVSIFLAILCPALRRTEFLIRLGPDLAIVILLACIIRMFLPFEFGYTYSIYLEKYWTNVYDVMTFCVFSKNGICVYMWQVLLIIWGVGAVYLLITRYRKYWRLSKIIDLLPGIPFCTLKTYIKDWENYPELEYLKVAVCPQCDSPFLKGPFKPMIVLSDRKWVEDELSYVLKHEVLHYRCHDIYLKVIVDILCTVFWWNPLFYLLKKKLFHLLEIRNDLRITSHMEDEEKAAYLDCLKNVAKSVGKRDQAFAIAFTKNNMRELKQRIEMVVKKIHRCSTAGLIAGISVLGIIFMSTCFVLEPVFPTPSNSGISLDEKNTYLIRDGEKYDVYVKINGKWRYFFTDNRRENFSRKVKVYEKGEKIDEVQS